MRSSGSRTALAVAAGARTQVHSLVIVVVVVVVVVVTWGRGLAAAIPSAALAAARRVRGRLFMTLPTAVDAYQRWCSTEPGPEL